MGGGKGEHLGIENRVCKGTLAGSLFQEQRDASVAEEESGKAWYGICQI